MKSYLFICVNICFISLRVRLVPTQSETRFLFSFFHSFKMIVPLLLNGNCFVKLLNSFFLEKSEVASITIQASFSFPTACVIDSTNRN